MFARYSGRPDLKQRKAYFFANFKVWETRPRKKLMTGEIFYFFFILSYISRDWTAARSVLPFTPLSEVRDNHESQALSD